jgi:hypothetical protein
VFRRIEAAFETLRDVLKKYPVKILSSAIVDAAPEWYILLHEPDSVACFDDERRLWFD